MTHMQMDDLKDKLTDMMKAARTQGADQADGVAILGKSQTLVVRQGAVENVDMSLGLRLGIRVIIGKRQACVTTNSLDLHALTLLVDQAIAMARVVPEDPFCGIAAPEQLAHQTIPPAFDGTPLSLDQLTEMAREAEAAALSVDGVKMTEGATASWGQSEFVLATSQGFREGYRSSSFECSIAALAGPQGGMQIDGYGAEARFLEDLESPTHIGQTAGKRAVRRLNPRKAPTGKFPVVYENLLSSSLLGCFLKAIKGDAIVEKTSFLQNALGQTVFPSHVTLVDDPLLPRGLGSYPFDGEGLPVQKRLIVDQGILKTWMLNLRTARQLNCAPTGHGTVALGGPPGISCSNFYMMPGHETVESLMRPIQQGFFVTELMGHTINPLTGDYSLGASGFWIEGGELAYPVHELTIAANLKEMFQDCTPANDLIMRASINAPTLRIASMSIAGGG